ncbi:aldehyde dehydrogenase family protein [Microbacterium sp. RD1]|uniref:aldehyde dehydrogenase family protein n=1 Tax=Microbacterium sp. RD1 TaxID=3457313 RepID=UPI003FA5F1B9
MTDYGLYVDGRDWRPATADVFASTNPGTGEVLGSFVAAGVAEVGAAVESSSAALAAWRRVKPSEKGRILLAVAARIRDQAADLALLETLDMGQTLTSSRGDVETAARYFEYYGGAADKMHGETIPLGVDYVSYTENEPFGVVAVILPWNAPINQGARGIAPALAAGNVVVAKPAEDASLTTLALARICVEAGLPAGVLNVVTGDGRTGDALVSHPAVRKVAFTGSVATGQAIMARAAERILPLTLELGGKSPNIVFADADLEAAAASAYGAFTFKSGQVCSAGTRLLVHEDVHDRLVALLIERARAARVGPGIEDLDMGSIANRAQFDRVSDYLALGPAEGATVAVGGGVLERGTGDGLFIEPTIFTGVSNSMRIAQEEIFGPVLSVIRFSSDEEAVQIANDTPYGLSAGIWTKDLSRAHAVARRIDAGQVYVNEYFAGGVETPFGGFKSSGIGREKGLEALTHYTQTKTITVRL